MSDERHVPDSGDAPPTADGFVAHGVDRLSCSRCGVLADVSDCEPFARVSCPECGQTLVVPVRIGKYFAYGEIGRGGMGTVFEAWDPALERMVAIKIVHDVPDPAGTSESDFVREARAAAVLNHPNIARVYDFGFHDGQPFLVMELVRGRHLDEMIRHDPPLDIAMVVQTAFAVTAGLAEAHAAGMIHGDIKPENILFDEDLNAKLVDFGLVSLIGDAGGNRVRGTPYYIPPERLRRQRLDARSDIYSLGATLFHALAGRPPFTGAAPREVALARLSNDPPSLRELRPDVPLALDRMVHRMLERDPARRHPTMASLLGDLRGIRAARSPPGTGAAHGNRRRRAVRTWGLAAGLAVLGLAAVLLARSIRRERERQAAAARHEAQTARAELDAGRQRLVSALHETWLTPWSNTWSQLQSAIEQVEARQVQLEALPASRSLQRALDTGHALHMQSLPRLVVDFEERHRIVLQALTVLQRTQDAQAIARIEQRMETLQRVLETLNARAATELDAARRHLNSSDRLVTSSRDES